MMRRRLPAAAPNAAGNRMLKVRLAGGKGNPTAAGARVTVSLADGRTRSRDRGGLGIPVPVAAGPVLRARCRRACQGNRRALAGRQSSPHTAALGRRQPVLIKQTRSRPERAFLSHAFDPIGWYC